MRTSIPKNNFSSGQIDRDVKGRYDLPLFLNGHELSRNFFHTVKGDCYYRTGFEFINEIGSAALYEFKFSQEQAYLLVFRVQYIEFWSYNENGEFVQVLDNNAEPLKVTHPYGTEVFNLNMTQNCDVLYINHNDGHYAEQQLKRTASNVFTLTPTTYTNSGTASLSSNSETENHGFPCTCAFYENRLNRCSSSKFPTYLYGSKGADYNNITVGTGTNDGYQFDLAEANSKALWLVSGVNSLLVGTAEGILTVNGGDTTKAITPEDITAKLSCRDGVSSVRPVHKDNFVFFVSSNKRQLYMFEYDVLLEQFKATNLSKGNYEITKGGIKKLANKFDRFGLIFALCGGKLLAICFSNDEAVNAWSEFTTDGEIIDICTVTRPDGNYDLFANVKRVINGITRYYLEKLSETVEFSRFEDFVSDIPKGANATDILEIKKEDKYAFYRKVAEELRDCNYLDCSIKYSGLKKTNISFDEDTSIITLNEEEYIESLYDSTYTTAVLTNGFVKITLSSEMVGMNGAVSDTVGIYTNNYVTDFDGLTVGANLYKVINKNIYTDKYVSYQTSGTWRALLLNKPVKVFNNKETDVLYFQGNFGNNKDVYADLYGTGQVYVGRITALNTSRKTLTINADTITPSDNYYMGEILTVDTDVKDIEIGYYEDSFKSSDVGKRIWYKTITGREYGIFDIEEFIDNYHVRVKKILEPTSNTCNSWYLSATYFSGLEHLEGETVSVVGNGGYIGDYVVQDGQVDISNANVNKVGSAIIGLKYKGILKSPNLGLMLQGTQTFTNMKNIYKMSLQFSFSAGGKIGSNLYDLAEIQDFNPEGLYDVPPLPMDDFKEIEYSDDYDKEKHYFVVQDSPLPFHITAIIPHYKHVSKT
jgi:hypothetical protein